MLLFAVWEVLIVLVAERVLLRGELVCLDIDKGFTDAVLLLRFERAYVATRLGKDAVLIQALRVLVPVVLRAHILMPLVESQNVRALTLRSWVQTNVAVLLLWSEDWSWVVSDKISPRHLSVGALRLFALKGLYRVDDLLRLGFVDNRACL